jgi:WD40 repeat protein
MNNDGRFLITGSADKSIGIWDWGRKKLFHKFEDAHTGMESRLTELMMIETLTCIASTSKGEQIVSGSTDSCIKIWNILKKECIATYIRAHSSMNPLL